MKRSQIKEQKDKSSKPSSSTQGLEVKALHRTCDPTSLGFDTTASLPKLEEVIGQPRAFRAMELGTEVTGPGFNIFVLGMPGSGKTTLIREYLERRAIDEPVPDDWCYVNSFSNPHQPMALRLPAGRGQELKKDIQTLLERCKQEIVRAFESKEYNNELSRLTEEQEKHTEAELAKLNKLASKYNFLLARTPFGFMLVPAVDGKPLKPEEIEKLSPEQRKKFESLEDKLQDEVRSSLSRIRKGERKCKENI